MTQTFLSLHDFLFASLPSRSATKRDLKKMYNMYFFIITINTSPQVIFFLTVTTVWNTDQGIFRLKFIIIIIISKINNVVLLSFFVFSKVTMMMGL